MGGITAPTQPITATDATKPWLQFPNTDPRSNPSNWADWYNSPYAPYPTGITYTGPLPAGVTAKTEFWATSTDRKNQLPVIQSFSDYPQGVLAGSPTIQNGAIYGGDVAGISTSGKSAWDIYADLNRAQFDDWYATYRPIEMQQFEESAYGADPNGYIANEVDRATGLVNQGFDRSAGLIANRLALYGMAPSHNRQLQDASILPPKTVVKPIAQATGTESMATATGKYAIANPTPTSGLELAKANAATTAPATFDKYAQTNVTPMTGYELAQKRLQDLAYTRNDFAGMGTTDAVLAASNRNNELQRSLTLTNTANGMRRDIVDRSRQMMAGGSTTQ